MTTNINQFKLLGPAMILIAILIVGLAAIPYYGVARLDAESRERQEALVERVRKREVARKPTGIPAPVAFSKIEVIGSDAVLLTASLFQPDFKTATLVGSHAPVLVSAIPIAGSLQEFLGDRFLLDSAAVGPLASIEPGRAWVEIAAGPGGQSEVLSWLPPTPARDLLHQSIPLAATVTFVLIAGGIFAIRLSRQAMTSLVESQNKMRHAATHDFLTGLPNRSLIAPEFLRLSAIGNITVGCLDLDGFKGVNDRYGHAAGDELLKQVAGRLRTWCRDDDVVFRLGGDEFAVLMPSIAPGGAEWRCRQLASLLAKPYPIDGIEVAVGSSFGIAEVSVRTIEAFEEALKAADEALYGAKAKGRNHVVMSLAPGSIRTVG